MTKVICCDCGNVQDTFGKWFWTCSKCSLKQTIENSVYEKEDWKEKNLIENPRPNKKTSGLLYVTQDSQENKILSPDDLVEENTLEIVEDKTENKEEIDEEKYLCPDCNKPVERYGDCLECENEIVWSEE